MRDRICCKIMTALFAAQEYPAGQAAITSPLLSRHAAKPCRALYRCRAAGDEERLDLGLRGLSGWMRCCRLSLRPTTARGSSVTPMSAATQPIMPSSVPSSNRAEDGQPNSETSVRAAAGRCSRCGTPARSARIPACPRARRRGSASAAPSPAPALPGTPTVASSSACSIGPATKAPSSVPLSTPATSSAVVDGPQAQPHRREAAMKFGEQRRAGGPPRSFPSIRSRAVPFGSPSSRAASTASRDSAAIRCA